MKTQLLSKLSKPSKVASILDWNKSFDNTILVVNFHKNRMGIAVASHPSFGIPCRELDPLRFNSRNRKSITGTVDRKCLERLSNIIDEYKVCGIVINWPLQRDTGRMGAACGRVLFALEQLWERSYESSTAAKTSTDARTHELNRCNNPEQGGLLSRPFCFWDAGHIDAAFASNKEDSFGRCASYGKKKQLSNSFKSPTLTRTLSQPFENEKSTEPWITAYRRDSKEKYHFSGKKQYYEDELTVLLGLWNDFSKEHWPDLCAKIEVKDKLEGSNKNAYNLPLYSDLGSPTESTSRLQEITKKKKILITMR